jgi:hypothetical protein
MGFSDDVNKTPTFIDGVLENLNMEAAESWVNSILGVDLSDLDPITVAHLFGM